MTGYGERMKNIRVGRGLTQSEVAAEVGVAISSISMYENEERVPSDTVKVAIANILGVSVGALFFSEDDTLS